VRSVVIGADNDPAGDRAAQDAARAFVLRGLTVRIIRPLDGHKDFNDELKGSRA
jgi:DNA primase